MRPERAIVRLHQVVTKTDPDGPERLFQVDASGARRRATAADAGRGDQRHGDGVAAEVGPAAFEPPLQARPPRLRFDAAADRPADAHVVPAAAARGRTGVDAGQDTLIGERAFDLAEGDAA